MSTCYFIKIDIVIIVYVHKCNSQMGLDQNEKMHVKVVGNTMYVPEEAFKRACIEECRNFWYALSGSSKLPYIMTARS